MASAGGSPDKNSYARYLQLDKLLSAQVARTGSQDELLFIVMHQSYEPWFKLAIHELACATQPLKQGVSGKDGASGFQSVQYRVFEYRLGLKYRALTMQTPRGPVSISVLDAADTPPARETLEAALAAPSIYDATIDFMARTAFGGIEPRRDYTTRYRRSDAVLAAWRQVYEDRHEAPQLYQLGEKLVDLEDAFRRWRFAHLATVSRVIGINPGTGGSSGLQYLQAAANQLIETPLYPELWEVRNAMFSRDLPAG